MNRPRNRTLPLEFEPYSKVVWLNYPDNIEYPGCLEYCGTYWENLLYNFFHDNEEIWQHIYQLSTDNGMTPIAIEIHFKYNTSDELIEHICNQAIQFMLKEMQPKFKVGQSALFKTYQSDLMMHNNCEVTVKRVLTDDECDIDEVGFIYEVTANGEVFQSFQDELS